MSKREVIIPKYNCPIIETHVHLDYLKAGSEAVVAEVHQFGIEKMITVSVAPENLDAVMDLIDRFPAVYGTQGVHPHEAGLYNKEVEAKIRENALHSKIVAIGEIGLDYHYTRSPREVQLKSFESQLQIAQDLDLPVVFHTREAEDDTISMLKNFPDLKKGVFHCYTSNQELADFGLDRGLHIGFNGILTFKAAQNVRDILHNTPLDRLLLETDAPFLTPAPYRGIENSPKFIPLIAKRMAEEKEVEVERLLEQIYQNSIKLFPKLA
ncbi:MAG: TatD family hydrolase [Bacteriovoracaceae bacterium]|nr:TatD family hydrolase [Bacteriovoracaceae bacterium]